MKGWLGAAREVRIAWFYLNPAEKVSSILIKFTNDTELKGVETPKSLQLDFPTN